MNIKATDGKYKDKSPLELAEDKEITSFITDFMNEVNSEKAVSGNIQYIIFCYNLNYLLFFYN